LTMDNWFTLRHEGIGMKRILFFTLIAAALAAGTGRAEIKAPAPAVELPAVQLTILRYTQLLADGYAQMNMTPLLEVATEVQALKVYRHMSALGDAKTRMESRLEDIKFLGVQLAGENRATSRTLEKWSYIHLFGGTGDDIPSGTMVEGMTYTLSYELVKQAGRWLVSSVTVLNEAVFRE
jgi:hypothetical protein